MAAAHVPRSLWHPWHVQSSNTWRTSADVADPGTPKVLVIGVFDGVHQGHRHLIDQARAQADRLGQPLVAVSFDPHPMQLVRPDRAPRMLTTVHHRVELLRGAGVDFVRLLTFDRALAQMSADDFITEILVSQLSAGQVVVGENFRFGHRASGTIDTLQQHGPRHGFDVSAVSLKRSSGDHEDAAWSSTRIRALLAEGHVDRAAIGLTRLHRIVGEVVTGDQRGRDLGYPTANLSLLPEDYGGPPAVPGDGVYAGWLLHDGQRLPAAISVGTNPTFGQGTERRVEAHVLDRDDLDLYGHQVAVEFAERLRGQVAFHSVDDLVEQMAADVSAASAALA